MLNQWPIFNDEDKSRVNKVIESGNLWRGNGEYLFELEEKFAQHHNSKYALATTNGTHSLEIALAACGIGFGDEVLVPAYTFIATASAVLMRNAIPVPVEVSKDTYCIDVTSIEKLITNKTKAIIPVHIAGHSCDMDRIMEIAKKHNLYVIEDAAHAHGSYYKNKSLGSIGHFATFSFQGIKTMTAGEGGMLTTSNEELYKKAYSIYNCGRQIEGDPYDHVVLSSNYRMSEIQAALLIGQIDRLSSQTELRDKNVKLLNSMMESLNYITPQYRETYSTVQGYSMYMFKLDLPNIEEVLNELVNKNYPIRKTYPIFYRTKMFKSLIKDHRQYESLENVINYNHLFHENADEISNKVLWLPHYFLLQDEQYLTEFYYELKRSIEV